jgi:hypothetical protein
MASEHEHQLRSMHESEILSEVERPIAISHFVHVLQTYRTTMAIIMIAVTLTYFVIALAIYLVTPAQRVTSVPFRLDFDGASRGEYPNKMKFNVVDIISTPIVARVWKDDHLGDYVPFRDFGRAVFVLESNREYELLAAEYGAKLADPKISSVDRERLQSEFQLRTQSIAKNEYAISITRPDSIRTIPEPIARKALLDILSGWADFAVNQQHIMMYQVSVLSPRLVDSSPAEEGDFVAAIEMLRLNATRVISNLDRISHLQGAALVRTPDDHVSLEEVRIRLDEIIRFRLEPLVTSVVASPTFVRDRSATVRFLESQLAYDQRQLEAAQRLADSNREALAVYTQPTNPPGSSSSVTTAAKSGFEQPKAGEAIMPQLSETFLDRLMALTGHAADAKYRQTLVDDYRLSVADTVPLKAAVAYDMEVIENTRRGVTKATSDATAVRAQIEQCRSDIRALISKMNDLFQIVSRNMTPAAQLFTPTGPPVTNVARGVSVTKLGLIGVVLLLITFPIVVIACLLHHRIREEEAIEANIADQVRAT